MFIDDLVLNILVLLFFNEIFGKLLGYNILVFFILDFFVIVLNGVMKGEEVIVDEEEEGFDELFLIFGVFYVGVYIWDMFKGYNF